MRTMMPIRPGRGRRIVRARNGHTLNQSGTQRLTGLRSGSVPDPRFTLANERTFLAWIRTALALMAAALALQAVGHQLNLSTFVLASLTRILLVGGAVIAIAAQLRWRRIEIALRHGRELPLPAASLVLTLGLGVVVGVLLVDLA